MSEQEMEGVAPEAEQPENVDVNAEQHAEEAEAASEESATSETDASDEQEKPKRRSRAEERINALTREKYEAQKQAETLHRQMQEMQQYLQQQQQPQPTVDDSFPTLDQYGYDENQYRQAVLQWNQQQTERQRQQQEQQARAYQEQQRHIAEQQTLQQALLKGQQKYPDFLAKVNDPSLPPLREMNQAAFQAIMESDTGVDVAYYLANNPQEVYEFASLNPVQAIRKVAQIEAKLAAKPVASKQPPAPPSKAKGSAEAVKDSSKMSTAEWMAWRNSNIQR
jgi:hypothetical protein